MTYEEMENFTHEELSYFTNGELSLEKLELICNIFENNKNIIPNTIVDKLYSICNRTIYELEKSNTNIPKHIKEILSLPHSQKLLCKLLIWIFQLIATSLLKAGISSIDVEVDALNINCTKDTIKNTYFISNGELNNELADAIECIKNTTNITIDFDNIDISINLK